jgi:outer membrane protein assembly factor BamD
MRAPERDQSATREALRELQEFLASFPQSPLRPEVEMKWREARSRLSEAEYRIGVQNLRMRAYRGAVSRFEQILEEDPEYPGRDAVYFHLAETYARADNTTEAIPYLERLLAEFPASERRQDAEELLAELKAR